MAAHKCASRTLTKVAVALLKPQVRFPGSRFTTWPPRNPGSGQLGRIRVREGDVPFHCQRLGQGCRASYSIC